MSKQRPVIYEPHPVAPERKRHLVAQGYRIVDIRYAPDRAAVSSVVVTDALESETAEQAVRRSGRAKR